MIIFNVLKWYFGMGIVVENEAKTKRCLDEWEKYKSWDFDHYALKLKEIKKEKM